jgi:hypothetical protein
MERALRQLPSGARIGRLMVVTEAGRPPIAFSPAYAAGAAAHADRGGEDKLTVTITARFELTQ